MGRRVGAAADSGTSQAAQHLGARGEHDRNASGLSYSTSTSTRRCLEVPPSLPPDLEPSDQRLVFVGGLHRSGGTTPLANWSAAHPDVSGRPIQAFFTTKANTFKSVYPIAAVHGGPGSFALRTRLPGSPSTRRSEHRTPPGGYSRHATPFWDTSKLALVGEVSAQPDPDAVPPRPVSSVSLHHVAPSPSRCIDGHGLKAPTIRWSRYSSTGSGDTRL